MPPYMASSLSIRHLSAHYVFLSCHHTTPPGAFPSNIKTYINPNEPEVTYITSPSDCLSCTLTLKKETHKDTKEFYDQLIFDTTVDRFFERATYRDIGDGNRNTIPGHVSPIKYRRQKGLERIWFPVLENWNGAWRSAKERNDCQGSDAKSEVLGIKLVTSTATDNTGDIIGVKFEWRDKNGTGKIVEADEVRL